MSFSVLRAFPRVKRLARVAAGLLWLDDLGGDHILGNIQQTRESDRSYLLWHLVDFQLGPAELDQAMGMEPARIVRVDLDMFPDTEVCLRVFHRPARRAEETVGACVHHNSIS